MLLFLPLGGWLFLMLKLVLQFILTGIFCGSISDNNFFRKCILEIVSPNLPTEYSKLAMTMYGFLSGIFKVHHSCYSKSDITSLITFQVNFPVSSTIFNSVHCLIILFYCWSWKDAFLYFFNFIIFKLLSIDDLWTELT